ncbi:hypothetical protein CONLIGDRAFT_633716 [Coniochaeta ligniaria NRRL 30616]|uniref:DUF7918 domain-containing protein n=1 Tax=Coniochaeta ligniaria NRRL 30616 TaxID=1408157 RepID=A0A1J7II02_9PEZI|nr:hypothetical protein CONLIGDRAFT_633716 [Coniochaeta ligniaria NRRL 30616]
MAVIKALGLSVSIVINGEAVPEYDDPDPAMDHEHPGTKVVSKYIESEDDIEYSIKCEVLPQHRWLPNREGNILEFAVTIDGKYLHTKCLGVDNWDNGAQTDIVGVPTYTGRKHGTLSKFRFGSINALDEADPRTVKKDLKRAKMLGIIRIQVWRAIEIESTKVPRTTAIEGLKLDLAGEALKGRAVSHGTTLAPAARASKASLGTRIMTEKVDKQPYAIFNFKYRSRDDLRSELIIPRSPSPDTSAEVEKLNKEELCRLASERLSQVKSERNSAMVESPRVKRAASELLDITQDRPPKTPRRAKERFTIDLTDD